MKIAISNYIESIRQLYFKEGKGKLITYKPIRYHFFYFSLLTLVIIAFLFVAINSNKYIFVTALGCLLTLGYLVFIMVQIFNYFKWKTSVESYLENLKEFNESEILLTENSFELLSANSSFIEKWSDVREVKSFNDHISFQIREVSQYIFPAASMSNQEFQELVAFVKDKTR